MLNIVDLEKRWMRYKIKSYVPHVSIFISIIVIVSVYLSFINKPQKTVVALIKPQETPIAKTVIKPKIFVANPVVVQKPVLVVPTEVIRVEPAITYTSKGVKLSPSLDFMKKMQNSLQPYYKNSALDEHKETQEVQAPIVEVVQQEKIAIEQPTEPVQPVVKVKSKKITIRRQNTQNDIHEIITRFKKNNNPALSLFVAKKYYELKDYNQAYNYALITNKINKDIESSWIIFAKSLMKMGKKDKAISTLKKYIKQSHSNTAQVLLDEIYSGRFK